MRRRAAIEPVIGHLKGDHRMGRNYLKGRDGDRINAVLAAVGYNFSLLLRWFEELLRALSLILRRALAQLVEQAGVLDGDDGLVGEVGEQFDLLIGERPDLLAVDSDHTE
jgi:hypothetical protein